jgi:hypothetical protein
VAARTIKYPDLNRTSANILWAALTGQRRSFLHDARAFLRRLDPPLLIQGSYPADPGNGLLLTVNHYSRPGFGAWWIALAIAGTCPWEMHWTVTSAWIYDDPLRSTLITPLSRWFLARLAAAYGFTSMPPMPPRLQDVELRALAVRQLLKAVDRTPTPVVGLAPEGADSIDGQLMTPPSGIGRLLAHLLNRGFKILPVAVYEAEHGLMLAIGSTLDLRIPKDRHQQDHQLSDQTMRAIAALLPVHLRGAYA